MRRGKGMQAWPDALGRKRKEIANLKAELANLKAELAATRKRSEQRVESNSAILTIASGRRPSRRGSEMKKSNIKKCRRIGKICRAMFYDGNNAPEIIKWLRGYKYLVSEYVNSQFPEHRFLRMVGEEDIASKRWIVMERYRGKDQPWKIHYWTTDVFSSIYKEAPND